MQGCFPRFIATYLLVLFLVSSADAPAAEIPNTWLDDAQLHDVQQVGSNFAIAVGEHGAVWRSSDGGRNWSMSRCGLDVSLRSVCFLDDRTGWIAGCDMAAFAGLDAGVLMSTSDGGQAWQRLGRDVLPSLNYVKFFGTDEGLVAGQPSSLSPAGIFRTADGGKTWQGVQGDVPYAWKAVCFLAPETGIVGGMTGRVSLMGGEQLHPSTLQPQGFRSIRGIKLLSNDTGWLAGDGGLVLKTSTGGVVWEPPPQSLPEDLREGIDFRAVEVRENQVWLAGSPGSVIWHSPDGGQHWKKQLTGQTSPLAALRFVNERQGIAVGAFGLILRTEDGGKSWKSIRGGDRRTAVLALHARTGKTSAPLIAKLSGELGFRSAVWIAQREDLGALSVSTESESKLNAAVQRCGGHAAEVYWPLPLTLPGIEFSSEKLISAWQKQTEGRLPQTLLGGIVRQIRTWRPSIVVIDQPSQDDAAGQILYDAALRAIGQAADPTHFPEQTELTGLGVWTVERIYVRSISGITGDAIIDLDEFLPYLKSSTRIAASPSIALLQSDQSPQIESAPASRIAYRWVGVDGKSFSDSAATSRGRGASSNPPRDFFAGLSIIPGSPARRDMQPIDESNLERMQKLVQKQRNFTAVFQKSLDDPRVAGQIIGQINGIVEGMEPSQAVAVLRDLADEYRKRSQFELVESTYVELIRRFPQDPGALDAMRWLVQFWSSSETAWQRTRLVSSGTTITKTDSERHLKRIQQAVAQSDRENRVITADDSEERPNVVASGGSGSPTRLKVKFDFDADQSTGTNSDAGTKTGSSNGKRGNTAGASKSGNPQGRLKISPDTDWRSGAISEWHTRASELAKQLQITSPTLFQSPAIQFPLAAMRRADGSARAADTIMREFLTNAINVQMKELAERELWASYATPQTPAALAICLRTSDRPHLDGLLTDPCWVEAKELRLSDDDSQSENSPDELGSSRHSMAMFAFDNEFLYAAFSLPRADGAPADAAQATGRLHDADLSRHDRVCIRLDIDRDYSTWYEFHVDQRGWTSESCWEDRRWNPTWFVAAQSDKESWRIEVAIPWNELTPNPPQRGTIYALSILRTIPSVGLQSWTHPAALKPQPSSFGLMKFR